MGDKIVVIHEDSATVVATPAASKIVTTTPDVDTVVDPNPPDVDPLILDGKEYVITPGPSPSERHELFDQDTPPTSFPLPYLRFERDLDGDIQTIYLGTVD